MLATLKVASTSNPYHHCYCAICSERVTSLVPIDDLVSSHMDVWRVMLLAWAAQSQAPNIPGRCSKLR